MDGMDHKFRYFAFISYSHKDDKWGEKIHRALLRYRFPSIVRKSAAKELPEKIHPIFFDTDNLRSGHVWENIKPALDQSRKLVVVCSPNSARPNADGRQWVNEEVGYFISQGRADDIIPIMVSGDLQTARCPTLLKHANILVHDIRELGVNHTISNIVAGIVGLDPDELWRREERQMRKMRILRGMVAGLFTLIVSLGFLSYWDFRREVHEYHSSVVPDFGTFKGAGKIGPEAAKGKGSYYRFTYCGWRFPPILGGQRILRKIETFQDGRCLPSEKHNYSETGELSEIISFNCEGVIKEKRIFTNGNRNRCEVVPYMNGVPKSGGNERMIVEFNRVTGVQERITVRHPNGKYEISSFDSDCPIRREEFFNPDGSRGCDENGSPVVIHVPGRDPFSGDLMEIAQMYRDATGAPFVNALGISGWTNVFNAYAGTLDVMNVNSNGAPVDSREGFAIERKVYNALMPYVRSRPVEIYRMDKDGRRVEQNGVYGIRMSYDDFFRPICVEFLDEDGNMLKRNSDSHIAKCENYYHSEGPIVTKRFYDEKNERCMNCDGVFGCEIEFDFEGRPIRRTNIGRDDVLCTNKCGWAQTIVCYDSLGRISNFKTTDANGGAVSFNIIGGIGRVKIAEIKISYDECGNALTESVLLPSLVLGEAVTTVQEKRTSDERLLSCLFLDSKKSVCDSSIGWARMKVSYNERGEWEYLDFLKANGDRGLCKIALQVFSRAMRTIKYNIDSIDVSERYLDEKLLPVQKGIFAINSCYDLQGRLKKSSAIDVMGKPCKINDKNMTSIEVEYDELCRIRRIAATPLDEANEVFDNWSSCELKYDDLNVNVAKYDRTGKKTQSHAITNSELEQLHGIIRQFNFMKAPINEILETHKASEWNNMALP